jgi:hypothetical protein
MISISEAKRIREDGDDKLTILELRGLSTDTKPTDEVNNTKIDNGSIFIEIDTGKVYMFDLENEQWKEI